MCHNSYLQHLVDIETHKEEEAIQRVLHAVTFFIINVDYYSFLEKLPALQFPQKISSTCFIHQAWQLMMKGDGLLFKALITDEILRNWKLNGSPLAGMVIKS